MLLKALLRQAYPNKSDEELAEIVQQNMEAGKPTAIPQTQDPPRATEEAPREKEQILFKKGHQCTLNSIDRWYVKHPETGFPRIIEGKTTKKILTAAGKFKHDTKVEFSKAREPKAKARKMTKQEARIARRIAEHDSATCYCREDHDCPAVRAGHRANRITGIWPE